jgi:osmoprotectant transport system ATP-binding protein
VVRSELHEFFLNLQRQISKTIILITHDIDEAVKLGDQVAILRVGGHLAQVGTPQQLLEEPADAFVEGFVGRDRGYRSLSFLPADRLSLASVKVVRDPGAARPGEPTLVLDADARPTGWVDSGRPGELLPLGATFDVESGNLRSALDAALTSPFGLAVGVGGQSRYAGVVSAEAILASAHVDRGGSAPAAAAPLPQTPGYGDHPRAELGDEAGDEVDPAALEPADAVPTADDVDVRR